MFRTVLVNAGALRVRTIQQGTLQKGTLQKGTLQQGTLQQGTFGIRSFSTEEKLSGKNLPYFVTQESDPRKHETKHKGRIYTMPESFWNPPNLDPSLRMCYPPLFVDFHERCIHMTKADVLIRQPALEAIELMNNVDTSKLNRPMKLVFYGKKGHGKTTTLSHLKNYLWMDPKTIVLNFGLIKNLLYRPLEVVESTYKKGLYDSLGNSQLLLKNFLLDNKEKFTDLKTHKTYSWSFREKSEENSPLLDILNQGLERPKYSPDCLNVFLRELKLHCQDNNCKLAIVIDGINPIFEKLTRIDRERLNYKYRYAMTPAVRERVLKTSEMTIIRAIKKLLGNDYNNSIILSSVDWTASNLYEKNEIWERDFKTNRFWEARQLEMRPLLKENTPFALLGEEGWEMMDPFVPIEVPCYEDGEIDVMIDHYVHNRFINEVAASEPGRKEIKFITGKNPKDFFDYSVMW